jgi:hypothetical protein
MAYPEKQYTVTGRGPSYPNAETVAGTLILAKDSLGNLAYVSASQLQTTMDGEGLATDTDISASNAARVSLSGSIATKMANTSFAYISGSTTNGGWNDASASAAGVPVGGLYHTLGTVKVRLS